MEYKILVKVYVPEIEENYEFYIPINKHVYEVIKVLNKAINNLSDNIFPIRNDLQICDRRTGEIYENGAYVRNTHIENGTQLILY